MPTNNIPVVEEEMADTPAETKSAAGALPSAGATVNVKAGKGSTISVPGATSMDEEQTKNILDRLQQYVDEKDTNKGFLNPLMKGLNLAYATTYGPDALQRAQAQYDAQDKDVVNTLSTMGSLQSSLAQNKAFLQAANAPVGGGAAGPGGTMPVQGGQLSPIDSIISSLPPSLQEQANIYKKMGTRAGYDEILKMGREYETKGRTTESKNAAEVFAMPEGPEKRIRMRELYSKAYEPTTIYRGGEEFKESGPGVGGAPSAAPSSSFVDSARALGLPVISGVRTPLQQAELRHHRDPETGQWMTRENRPVAEDSKHLTGEAIDLDPSKPLDPQQRAWLQANAYRPDPGKDANHWQLKPAQVAVPAPGTPGSVSPTSVSGAAVNVENIKAGNAAVQEKVINPLFDKVQADNDKLPAMERAVIELNNPKTDIGPGSSIRKLVTETKGIFTKLSQKDLDDLTSKNIVNQAMKKDLLGGLKQQMGSQISDKDVKVAEQAIGSIDDPRKFLKATIEFERAQAIARANMYDHLASSGTLDKQKALAAYQKSGKYMQDIRDNAPSLFKGSAAAPAAKPAVVHSDDAARAWLAKNPNDPMAAAVRKSLEGK